MEFEFKWKSSFRIQSHSLAREITENKNCTRLLVICTKEEEMEVFFLKCSDIVDTSVKLSQRHLSF